MANTHFFSDKPLRGGGRGRGMKTTKKSQNFDFISSPYKQCKLGYISSRRLSDQGTTAKH